MDDIVVRLRQDDEYAIFGEAADEIDRLRVRLAAAEAVCQAVAPDYETPRYGGTSGVAIAREELVRRWKAS